MENINEILDNLMRRLQELQSSLSPVATAMNGGRGGSIPITHVCKCGEGVNSSPSLLHSWGDRGEREGLMSEAGVGKGKGKGGGRQTISVGEELERLRDTQRQLLVKVRRVKQCKCAYIKGKCKVYLLHVYLPFRDWPKYSIG